MKTANLLVIGAAAAALLLSGCREAPAASQQANGASLYNNYCTPCHGAEGVGQASIGAPNLTGLPEWYLERQFYNFQHVYRGYHFDDLAGHRMRPMAQTLSTDAQVAAVISHIASLPVVKPEPTLAGGDAAKGKALYATCAACHGADGKGNEVLNAPPLTHASDFYALTQLKNFKAGVRGTHPKDAIGAQMRPMSMTLADEQAMIDVIAYIQTL